MPLAAGPAQENLDFYAGVLGMRLVKRSVNQDDPGTYHFFFADAEGHPGSDLTFFPWPQLAPPRLGHGLAVEVALEVPAGSLRFWGERLERYQVGIGRIDRRFGELVMPIVDLNQFSDWGDNAGDRTPFDIFQIFGTVTIVQLSSSPATHASE